MARRHFLRSFSFGVWAAGLGAFGSYADASTFTTLYSFPGGSSGSEAFSGLAQDAAGIFYGETNTAGATTCASHYGVPSHGCGTLYSFSRTAGLTTLVTFTGPNGAYGAYTPILQGSTLYASTSAGGATDNGVVFSVGTNGSDFKLLHQFTGTDGSQPSAPLLLGPGPVLYGVTAQGGPTYPKKSYGVLFRLSADGSYTILHSFTNGTDGAAPGSIVLEKNGIIVGSTFSGGNKSSSCGSSGCGIVYEYDPRTSKFTVLHSFVNTFHNPGASPMLGSVSSNGTVFGNASSFFSESPTTGFTSLPGTSTIDDIGGGINVGPVLGVRRQSDLHGGTGQRLRWKSLSAA